MWLSDMSVRRPLVAVVISALLTVFGLVAFAKLTVREMPDVQTPSVSITTTYEGAAPEVMESQVTKPIEDQLSGISGIKNINSVTRKGRSSITVEFKLGWNMLEGTSDVRDAISRARPRLPDEADEPMVTKDNGNGDVAIWLNFSSTQMDRTAQQLADAAKGGYVLKDCAGTPELILIATGSEVELAVAAYEQLTAKGRAVRVVSLPATDVFDAQSAEYKESVLPSSVTKRVAIEAGIADYWYKYVGFGGKIIGMTTFGESAPAELLFKEFGFTVENVVATAESL